jgi:hypothetical protein
LGSSHGGGGYKWVGWWGLGGREIDEKEDDEWVPPEVVWIEWRYKGGRMREKRI